MAGQAGYYMVSLTDGSAGIVKVNANQHPVSVGSHAVTKLAYLGTTEQDILANFAQAVGKVGAFGLYELGPPGTEQAIIGSGVDQGTLIQQARDHGAGILTHTPSSAEWDPTFTIIAAGLGGIVSGAVRSAAASAGADAAATNTATGATEAGATGATAGGAAGKAASAATKVAAGAAKVAAAVGIGALFGNAELWKGVGLIVAGVLILLIAGREVAKL